MITEIIEILYLILIKEIIEGNVYIYIFDADITSSINQQRTQLYRRK